MCIKSRNHLCSQSLLLFILVLSLFLFSISIICHLGLYFVTSPDNNNKSDDLIALSAGETPDDDVEILKNHQNSDSYGPEWIMKTNCSWVQAQIDTGKLFGFCDDSSTDSSKLNCFRE